VVCLLLLAGECPKEKPLGRGRLGDNREAAAVGDDVDTVQGARLTPLDPPLRRGRL
jgi:hypothetical protein